MLPYSMIAGGTFTATASTPVDIELISQNPPDYFVARNLGSSSSTGWGEVNDAQAIEWFWYRSMAQGTARGILQSSDGTNPAMIARLITADGISTYDTANPPVFAALATSGTDVDRTTYVVTMANTGTISVGDWVRLYGTTSMLEIAGYEFQVTAVTANTSITLGYMASSGTVLAVDATAGFVKKFIPNRMYPRKAFVANITQAAQAVVSFTGKNDYTAGEIVSLKVPSEYGMIEINNLQVRVLSVTNSATVSSITLDLNTTGFTAFAFPLSAVAATGVTPAICVPAGSGIVPNPLNTSLVLQPPGTNLLDAFDNRNTRIIHMGASLFTDGTTGDIWSWQAFKYDQYNGQ